MLKRRLNPTTEPTNQEDTPRLRVLKQNQVSQRSHIALIGQGEKQVPVLVNAQLVAEFDGGD
jgi:hypothetical protein